MEKEKLQELASHSADQHFNAKHEGDWYAHYYGFIYGFQQAETIFRNKAIEEAQKQVTTLLTQKFGLQRSDQFYLLDGNEVILEIKKLLTPNP